MQYMDRPLFSPSLFPTFPLLSPETAIPSPTTHATTPWPRPVPSEKSPPTALHQFPPDAPLGGPPEPAHRGRERVIDVKCRRSIAGRAGGDAPRNDLGTILIDPRIDLTRDLNEPRVALDAYGMIQAGSGEVAPLLDGPLELVILRVRTLGGYHEEFAPDELVGHELEGGVVGGF
eukprot:CAMPEP_0113532490 /NCGR_PEP_ID=MMETSP0015_2-20120614/4089_1 /TAXON_ID=2838 /ORGANISM="Odontella" /LENGTH=174 /DNA_ID=CAMNT_0000431459 /DNA_START=215 /DNA_END=740 /DNA_ORIENTATION=- /assembly_acc=CAM_ASM_000160